MHWVQPDSEVTCECGQVCMVETDSDPEQDCDVCDDGHAEVWLVAVGDPPGDADAEVWLSAVAPPEVQP